MRSRGCERARRREAGAHNESPKGKDADPPARIGVAASVCGRAFHAGTPVCSDGGGCIGSRATQSRLVRGGKEGSDKGTRKRERGRYAEESNISDISEGEREKERKH